MEFTCNRKSLIKNVPTISGLFFFNFVILMLKSITGSPLVSEIATNQ